MPLCQLPIFYSWRWCPAPSLTILILFGRPLWEHMTSEKIPFRPLVVLMLITVYGGLLYRLPYSLYQAQQKVKKCVTLDLAGFVLSIGISLLLVVGLKKGVYGMMLGGCVAQALIALIITGLLLKEWFVPKIRVAPYFQHPGFWSANYSAPPCRVGAGLRGPGDARKNGSA